MTYRVRLFLGGYVNINNAQNLNCLALAQHLDKSKFDITILRVSSKPSQMVKDVKIFNCMRPHKIFIYWAYFFNILKADVVYLPKAELLGFNSFLCKIFAKKSFTTIEGILDETNFNKAKKVSGDRFLNYYSRLTKVFSISKFVRDYNLQNREFSSERRILYLGANSQIFFNKERPFSPLSKVILIANNFTLKGIEDYLELAKKFTNLEFHLVGQGDIVLPKLDNLIHHGKLSQQELSHTLKDIQLHILPSRSEGFPKVILETACAGVPSLVYSDYGASQWISHYQNGFVADTLEDMKIIIKKIQENKILIDKVSKYAIELGLSYDWKIKVNNWEEIIKSLYNNTDC